MRATLRAAAAALAFAAASLVPASAAAPDGVSLRPDVVTLTVTPRGCRAASCTRSWRTHNARVSSGAVYFAGVIDGATSNPAPWIALSSDTASPANGDVTCPSVMTVGGSTWKAATIGSITAPATLGAAASVTYTDTWTATATTAAIYKACLGTTSSGGTLIFEAFFSTGSTVLNSGDSINLTWAFSF